jgi:hypothetical protein
MLIGWLLSVVSGLAPAELVEAGARRFDRFFAWQLTCPVAHVTLRNHDYEVAPSPRVQLEEGKEAYRVTVVWNFARGNV